MLKHKTEGRHRSEGTDVSQMTLGQRREYNRDRIQRELNQSYPPPADIGFDLPSIRKIDSARQTNFKYE